MEMKIPFLKTQSRLLFESDIRPQVTIDATLLSLVYIFHAGVNPRVVAGSTIALHSMD